MNRTKERKYLLKVYTKLKIYNKINLDGEIVVQYNLPDSK
jgi:hypothetical protein